MNSNQIFCTTLIILLLTISSRGIIYWFEYKINYKYIITNLCNEKNKPINTCQGKCHLKANLEKTDEENDISKEKIPQLRLKFEENITGIFDPKLSLIAQNRFYNKLKLIEFNFKNIDSKEPPTPPPEFHSC